MRRDIRLHKIRRKRSVMIKIEPTQRRTARAKKRRHPKESFEVRLHQLFLLYSSIVTPMELIRIVSTLPTFFSKQDIFNRLLDEFLVLHSLTQCLL